PLRAFTVTKSEIKATCKYSKEDNAAYLEAQDRFAQAAVAYEEAVNDVARVEHQQAHIADTIEGRKAAHQKVAETAQRKAVELYMRGAASSPSALLSEIGRAHV